MKMATAIIYDERTAGCFSNATQQTLKTATHKGIQSKTILFYPIVLLMTMGAFALTSGARLNRNMVTQQDLNRFCSSPAWHNPCNGTFSGESSSASSALSSRNSVSESCFRKRFRKKALRPLKRELSQQIMKIGKMFNATDLTPWEKHAPDYKFLPSDKFTKNLTLHTWHRDIQIFTGGFAYLYVLSNDTGIKIWEETATALLCVIEGAVNKTSRLKHPKVRPLKFLDCNVMTQLLEFKSPLQSFNSKEKHLDKVDLMFLTHQFFGYLRKMRRGLRNHLRSFNGSKCFSASSSRSQISGRGKGRQNRKRKNKNTLRSKSPI